MNLCADSACRKQVLTRVVTLWFVRRRPSLLVGAQQGALIVLMASLPLVVEAALRGRVSTEVEQEHVESPRGVCREPSIQELYTDCAFLAQAVPDTFEPQRKLRAAILVAVAPVQGQQRAVSFWNGLSQTLGFV